MKLSTMLFIAALGTASAVATAQQSADNAATDRASARMGDHKAGDKISAEEFAKKAGAAGLAEVEMGKLGAQKATDPDVKAYAQKMVTDHTKGNKELMAATQGKNLEVPTAPDMMHKGMMEKFEHQKADTDFNHDYMQQMVRDHKKVIELYTTAANDSTLDVDLRALANKSLPVLQKHLAEAQKLEGKFAKK